MSLSSASKDERTELTEAILQLYAAFSSALLINLRDSWLSVELTMPQIKILLLVVTSGCATTSGIAKRLGVSLPSATRFVDRLVEHRLVAREEDPHDRRYTNIVPTAEGQQIVENLNSYRREYLGTALAALGIDALREVRRGLHQLVTAAPASTVEPARILERTPRG